MQQTTAV